MKKLSIIISTLVLSLALPLMAEASPARLVDEADLLTPSEEKEVLTELNTVSEDIGMDVVVVTVQSLGGTEVNNFTINYHDTHGYGMGEEGNCTLLLICPEERDYCIRGFGHPYFSDSVFDKIASSLNLSDENFYYSFMTFASEVKHEYEIASMNGGRGPFYAGKKIGIALVIGLVIGGIALFSLMSQLKSVYKQSGAADYTREGSFNVSESRDHFIYSQVVKTEIPKTDSNSSSSGSSYGGTSGKY